MRRIQLLLPPDLHRRAAEVARARRTSLGNLVREALREYLARAGDVRPSPEAIERCSWPSRTTILVRIRRCRSTSITISTEHLAGRDGVDERAPRGVRRHRRLGRAPLWPDQYHARARAQLRRIQADGIGLVTTEWVVAEAVTLFKARGAVDHAVALGEAIQAGRLGHLVESSPDRRRRAWELFVRYRDLRAGWVDCASFAVMEELGLDRYFGFDQDFVRAGFTPFR